MDSTAELREADSKSDEGIAEKCWSSEERVDSIDEEVSARKDDPTTEDDWANDEYSMMEEDSTSKDEDVSTSNDDSAPSEGRISEDKKTVLDSELSSELSKETVGYDVIPSLDDRYGEASEESDTTDDADDSTNEDDSTWETHVADDDSKSLDSEGRESEGVIISSLDDDGAPSLDDRICEESDDIKESVEDSANGDELASDDKVECKSLVSDDGIGVKKEDSGASVVVKSWKEDVISSTDDGASYDEGSEAKWLDAMISEEEDVEWYSVEELFSELGSSLEKKIEETAMDKKDSEYQELSAKESSDEESVLDSWIEVLNLAYEELGAGSDHEEVKSSNEDSTSYELVASELDWKSE